MNNQSLKKQISTATFFFIILFFAALDVESKDLNKVYELDKDPPITCPAGLVDFQAPQVTVTNSLCTGVVAAGGVLGDPVDAECPTGSSLQYRTDNSSPWSFTRPMYDQVTQTRIYTRCICDMDPTVVSEENFVTTSPQECPGGDGCPSGFDGSMAPPVEIVNSTCMSGTVSGGSITSSLGCPADSEIEFSLNNSTWSRDVPAYDQTTSITIYTRCVCDMDGTRVSLTRSVVTTPGECLACPSDLATTDAPVVEVNNSTCLVVGGTPSGGTINAPSTNCPTGSVLEYSTDELTWTSSRPSYDQTTALTIYTRCNCEMDNTISSRTGEVVTAPGTCPTVTCDATLSTTTAPIVNITNSTCTVVGGTPSGGIIAAPSTSCPTGSVLEYSVDELTWTSSRPTYNQTTALTIYTRCNCDDSEFSRTGEATTIPGICPTATCDATLSSTTAPVVRVTNSTCTVAGGTPSGGVLSAPSTPCPTGSSIQYSVNNGITWSSSLPSYSQNTTITIATRCLCDIDNSVVSMVSNVTTEPGICPFINTTIPTMSQWGLIIFGLLILNIGVVSLYRLERDFKRT